MVGDLLIDVREDRLQARSLCRLRDVCGLLHLGHALLVEGLTVALLPEAAAREVCLEAGHGVLLLPLSDERLGDVTGRVVGGRVPPHTEGQRFNERRPLPSARALDRLSGHLSHGEEVVPIDDDTADTVSLALDGKAVGCRLLLSRHRDRVAIVLAEEDRG